MRSSDLDAPSGPLPFWIYGFGYGALAALWGALVMLAIVLQSPDLLIGAIAVGLFAAFGTHLAFRRVRRLETERDILTEKNVQLERDLGLDPLTGHLNRVAFNKTLHALATNEGSQGMVMLLFFDLDRFKEVNDTLGHDVGDMLLKEVAKRASEILGGSYATARLGGDEFAAILPWEDHRQPIRIGQAIVDAIGQPFQLDGRMVEVSASVGIAIGDPAIHGGDELLRRADLAMYEVKGSVHGGFHIFDDMLSNRQMRENRIRTELGHSMFGDRFALHYQPIIGARSGKIEKAEALLRPDGGPLAGIPPSLMVSVAEDSGQIVALTEWTLDTAMAASKALGIPVAVNVSPVYFRHSDFAERTIDRLLAARVAPANLIIEVTEGVLISDIATARSSIDQLREVGIGVYLDDFGTGYSSLSYLQNFELDGMKLDRSFLQDLGKKEKAKQIIRSMVDFSHSLEMAVVIEGVESDWQARLLQLIGCDYLQGFELGVPMPLNDLQAIIRDHSVLDGALERENLSKVS